MTMVTLRLTRGVGFVKQGYRRSRLWCCEEPPRTVGIRDRAANAARSFVTARPLSLREHHDINMRSRTGSRVPPALLILHRGSHSQGPTEGRSATSPLDGHGKEVPQEDKAAAEVGKAKTEVKTTEEDVDLDDVDTSNMTTWQYLRHIKERVKIMRKRYWLVALGTYGALYATGFGAVYAVLATGLVDPMVDTSHVLQQLSEWTGADANPTLSEYVRRLQYLVETNPKAEKALMAFVANEIVETPRAILVFFITPPLARALGKAPPKRAKKVE